MATSVNLDISQRLDITCRRGDTFTLTLNVTDSVGTAIALTPYSFKMEVRNSSTNAIVIADSKFVFTKDADSTAGKLNIVVSAANMIVTADSYIYDLQTTIVSDVQTWLFGVFTVNNDVTA